MQFQTKKFNANVNVRKNNILNIYDITKRHRTDEKGDILFVIKLMKCLILSFVTDKTRVPRPSRFICVLWTQILMMEADKLILVCYMVTHV